MMLSFYKFETFHWFDEGILKISSFVFQVWNNIRIFIRGRYRTVDFIPLLLFSAWWEFHLLK